MRSIRKFRRVHSPEISWPGGYGSRNPVALALFTLFGLVAMLLYVAFGDTVAMAAGPGEAHFAALGQIESGGDDHAVGAAGEVSRHQILPAMWRKLARPGDDPTREPDARRVARQLWIEDWRRFIVATGDAPTPSEAYALWAAPTSFRRKGYRFGALSPSFRSKCVRFANLVGQ
jgi:hypothetical protein